MANFNHTSGFTVLNCYKCNVAFGIPDAMYRRRQDDHQSFWCPAGHEQYFSGKSEAENLRESLEKETAKVARLQSNVADVRNQRDAIAKAHRKMRVRVMNGVCPCCNRSFENLRDHMATKHPDFGQERTLRALREAFGMTQAQVATEAWTKPAYVSLYETGKPVPAEARERLEGWLASQSA